MFRREQLLAYEPEFSFWCKTQNFDWNFVNSFFLLRSFNWFWETISFEKMLVKYFLQGLIQIRKNCLRMIDKGFWCWDQTFIVKVLTWAQAAVSFFTKKSDDERSEGDLSRSGKVLWTSSRLSLSEWHSCISMDSYHGNNRIAPVMFVI